MVMLCLASAVMSFEMAAGAYADTEGPGAGLSETRNTTISHGSPQNAGAAFENMTAVELDVSIAEITGNVEIAIAAAPGSPESYGLAYPKTIYRVTGDGGNGWIQIAYDGHFAYLDGNSGQVTVKNTWNIPTADESRADMIKQAMNLLDFRKHTLLFQLPLFCQNRDAPEQTDEGEQGDQQQNNIFYMNPEVDGFIFVDGK